MLLRILIIVSTVAVMAIAIGMGAGPYKGKLLPESVSPCDENASRVVRDTRASKWPIKDLPPVDCSESEPKDLKN